MDKELLKKVLREADLSEAKPVGLAITNKVKGKSKKSNDDYYKEVSKKMEDYEKESISSTPDAIDEPKFNYDYENEVEYHEDMEIRNGMEMLNYDRKPSEKFSQRAKEAIEGSNNMGNNPEWANVVPKQQGFTGPEFGKELVKTIERSKKKRDGASELSNKNTTSVNATDFKDSAMTNKKAKSIAISEDNSNNKPELKETTKMKRLKFKKAFNGIETALNVIPESYKVDNKVFELTDGNEHYKIRWEGSLNEGTAIVLNAYDDNLVKEDFDKIKHLMNFKSQDTLGNLKGSQRLDENQAFADMIKKARTIMTEGEKSGESDLLTYLNDYDTSKLGDPYNKGIKVDVVIDDEKDGSKTKRTIWIESEKDVREDLNSIMSDTQAIDSLKISMTEGEGAEHQQELSPETYDSVRDAGLKRDDSRGEELAKNANTLKYRPVIGKEVKFKTINPNVDEGDIRVGTVKGIRQEGEEGSFFSKAVIIVDVPSIYTDGPDATEHIRISRDNNDVKVGGHKVELDRHTANMIAKVKELAFGVESKANDFKQLAETDNPDLGGDGDTEEVMTEINLKNDPKYIAAKKTAEELISDPELKMFFTNLNDESKEEFIMKLYRTPKFADNIRNMKQSEDTLKKNIRRD